MLRLDFVIATNLHVVVLYSGICRPFPNDILGLSENAALPYETHHGRYDI